MRKKRSDKASPSVEPLEGRLVPATIAVTTFADVVNPNDGVVSLREAISRANATTAPDVIQLRAGVYRITLPATEPGNDNLNGDFDVSNSLSIVGVGRAATVIQGLADRTDRLFNTVGAIGLTFTNLALRNGGNGTLFGGAVQALTANVTLVGVAATGHFGLKGAAINAESGSVTLRDSLVANNRAFTEGGGGVFAGTGNVLVDGSTVVGNIARRGGGIFAGSGTVTVSNSTVARNLARESGGGIFSESGTVNLTNNTSVRRNVAGVPDVSAPVGTGGGVSGRTVIVNNSGVSGNVALRGSGGGILATGTVTVIGGRVNANVRGGVEANVVNMTNGTVIANTERGGISCFNATLTGSTVSGNAGTTGGGILAGGTATLIRSTVSGNVAAGAGGGVFADRLNLTNSTVSGNVAGTGGTGDGGGGVFAVRGAIFNSTIVDNVAAFGNGGGVRTALASADPLRVRNTIIANNLFLDGSQDVTGAFLSQGNNLIGLLDGSSGGFGAAGDQLGTALAPIDPFLAPLANNGGPTLTHALLLGSTAIDRGGNVGAPATDQRGAARVRDGDGNGRLVADIGAFER